MPVTEKKIMIRRVLAALAVSGGLALAAPAAQALAMPVPAVLPAAAVTYPSVLPAPVVHVTPGVSKATVSWAAIAGGAVYEVRAVPAGGGATTRYDHVTSAHFVVPALHSGRYVVNVRAGRSWSDVHGHWSASRYFTVAAPAPAYSSAAARALAWAQTQAGKWYAWGGTGPSTYDCSGLVMVAYEHAGIQLPRTTYEMLASWHLHRTYSPQAGDLAFYGSGHVELYVRAGVTFGAHQSGERIGERAYSGSWQPTAFYRAT